MSASRGRSGRRSRSATSPASRHASRSPASGPAGARKPRSFRGDVGGWPMPGVDEESEWLQFYTRRIGGGKVVGMGINHENMTGEEVEAVVGTYEQKYGTPTADPLWHGCGKFVAAIQRMT